MVTRRQKLLAAGLVLAAGVALSWPLRRTEPLLAARLGVSPPAESDAAKRPSEAVIIETTGSGRQGDVREDAQDPFANTLAQAGTNAAEAPVFSTVSSGLSSPAVDAAPGHQIHVVHEGDSLDRLAKRYLGDEGRALEIFDLNRDVLDNPHVLRIGVELRIPTTDAVAH